MGLDFNENIVIKNSKINNNVSTIKGGGVYLYSNIGDIIL